MGPMAGSYIERRHETVSSLAFADEMLMQHSLRGFCVAVLPILSLVGCATFGPAPVGADPVILVGGTITPEGALAPLAWRLRRDGFDAHVFELVDLGLADIDVSARALSELVRKVLARTGASRVDLIGHSQGALVARQYIKFHGGVSKVDDYIALAGPEYGTRLANFADRIGACFFPACREMAVGSDFLEALNAGDDTPGAVRYTTISTLFEEFIHPVENTNLRDGATNVKIQDKCPLRAVDHLGLIFDGTVYSVIARVLSSGTVESDCWAR